MQCHLNHSIVLEKHRFREIMGEAKDLIQLAKRLKYNLMDEKNLILYDFWSPYVLEDIPLNIVNSPGFKIAFLQVMSIILAINGEKEGEQQPQENEKSNIINFLDYRHNKNNNVYNISNIK